MLFFVPLCALVCFVYKAGDVGFGGFLTVSDLACFV